MNLKILKNEILLSDLKNFVQEEKRLIKQILEYLEEVETRKLFAERGFSSMFAFCVEYLEYTHQEAQVRIQAMRLAKAVPEVKSQIEKGTLSLTVAAKVQGHIARENKIKKEAKVTLKETRKILEQVQNQSVRNSDKLLLEIFPHHVEVAPDKVKTVSSSSVRVELNLDSETYEMLRDLQALRAHAYPDQDLKHLIKDLAKLGSKKWNPVKASSKKTNAPPLRSPTVKINSRYIPTSLKRKIWMRDRGKCQYKDYQTGRRCLDRFRLQLDHVKPFALGGEHSEKNLRLMCWRHNALRAEKTIISAK